MALSVNTNYLTDRLETQIDWYSTKATNNKFGFHLLQIMVLIVGATIPIVNIVDFAPLETRLISSVLGSVTVTVTGIIQLKKYHENWIMYRSTEEALKKEKYTYQNEVGEYSGLTPDERLKRLVENVESIISNQNVVYFVTHERAKN